MRRSSGPAGHTRSPSTACRRRATRILQTGPGFFTTMQIPMLRGREIDERDRQGTPPVAVVSDLFARTYFGERESDRAAHRRSAAEQCPRSRNHRRRGDGSIRRAQARDSAGRVRPVRAGPVRAAAADDVRAAHRRRSAALRQRRPPDRARGRRARAGDERQDTGRRHRSDHQPGDRLRQTLHRVRRSWRW